MLTIINTNKEKEFAINLKTKLDIDINTINRMLSTTIDEYINSQDSIKSNYTPAIAIVDEMVMCGNIEDKIFHYYYLEGRKIQWYNIFNILKYIEH